MGSDKQELRESVWAALIAARADRFPGALRRIPNFSGSENAAEQLLNLPEWRAAGTLKINPDSPQRPVRYAALKAGKRVYLPVPRLAQPTPFIELDPRHLPADSAWVASSVNGAMSLGRPITVEALLPLDLIVTGCVGADRDGARLGKGGGYSDLEYALLREAGKVGPDTCIATTLHPSQLLECGQIPVEAHDISLDILATPSRVIRTARAHPRPSGLFWARISAEQRDAIPCLQALWEQQRAAVSS